MGARRSAGAVDVRPGPLLPCDRAEQLKALAENGSWSPDGTMNTWMDMPVKLALLVNLLVPRVHKLRFRSNQRELDSL